MSFSVTLGSWLAVHSTVTYFEHVLCRSLWVDFDDAYTVFFSIDCPCSVHLYCSFSLWRQVAPQQSAKLRTAFLVNFVPV